MLVNNLIGKDLIVMVLAKCSTSAIGLITTMILSKYLTLFEYGSYQQLLLVVQLLVSVFSLGLPNSVSYFVPKEKNKTYFFSQYLTLISLIAVLIGGFAFLGIDTVCEYFSNNTLSNYTFFVCLYPWTLILINSMDNICIVLNQTKFLAKYKILNSILAACSAGLSCVSRINLRDYLIIFISSQALISIVAYVFICSNVKGVKPLLKMSYIKSIFIFSIPIGLASIVGTINSEIDKLVISHYESEEIVAVYSNSSKELPFALFATALTSLLLPKLVILFSKEKKSDAIRLWNNSSEFSFVFMAYIVCLLIVFSKEVIEFLYSDKFLTGQTIFVVYSVLLLFRFTYFGMFLNAGGYSRYILYSSIISIICNIVLDFCFYFAFGIIGPAIATLLSQCIMNISQLVLTSRIYGYKFTMLLPWKKIGITLLINIVLMFLVLYFRLILECGHSIIGIISIVFIWTVIEIILFYKREIVLFGQLGK